MPDTRSRILSERDLQLIGALESSPNATKKELSSVTNIPVSTVSKRLSKLREIGVITSCVDRAVLEKDFPMRSLIAIHLNSAKLKLEPGYCNQQEFVRYLKKGPWNEGDQFKELAGLVLIHRVFILLGGSAGDIMVEVSARNPLDMTDFLTKCIHLCPGVINTDTATIGFVV